MQTPALILAVVLSAQVLAAPPQPKGAAADPMATARAHFLSHAAGTPTTDTLIPLPPMNDPRAAGLKVLLESVREVQLGCVAPCVDDALLVYRGKVEMIGANLGLDGKGVAQALGRYLPKGKPRLRGAVDAKGAQPMGDKMVEAQVLQKLLSNDSLGAARDGLNRRALALANALGRGRLIDVPDTGGTAGMGGAAGQTMSAEQIQKLNALPRAQAQILRNLASKAPPPPSNEGYRDFENKDGLVARSRAYWDAIAEDPKTGDLKRAGIATMVSLFEVFNLRGFENSCFRLAKSASNPEASRKQVLKDSASAVGNGALVTLGFLPVTVMNKLTAPVSKLMKWVSTKGLFGKPAVEGVEGTAAAVKRITEAAKSGKQISAEDAALLAENNVVVQSAESLASLPQVERVATIESRINAGMQLHVDDAKFYAEFTRGRGDTVFHTTEAIDKITATRRLAATTEDKVYAARRPITNGFRQFTAGVKAKDGLVVLQGEASKLFQQHEIRGLYSALKRGAGQQVTSGKGDIIITKAFFDPKTNTLTVTGARMAQKGEQAFMLQSQGFAKTRMWGRRILLDGGITSGTAFVVAPAEARDKVFEYALGDTPMP